MQDTEDQLQPLLAHRNTLELQLKELELKCQQTKEEMQAKLEQQHVWKQLQKAMQAVLKMQQEKQKLDQRQYWVNALKYAVYKGEELEFSSCFQVLNLSKCWSKLQVAHK